jgi:chorismate dehydratase
MMNFRFGASDFLNSAPLVEGLRGRSDVVLVHDAPSRLAARLLATGEDRLDAALVPVVEPILDRRLAIIPGIGVAAGSEVRSVLLRSAKPLAEIRSVALDPASRTSNHLVRILAARHFHIAPRFLDPNEASEKADAAVVIGDRALIEPPGAAGDIDLGAAWRVMTGLPFVFAVWAHRAGDPDAARLNALARESLVMGRARLDAIADRHAIAFGLESDFCRDYLKRHVYFTLGDREEEGLALFAKFLREEVAA